METSKTSSDEIDLQELFLKIVMMVRRNFSLIVLFFTIGTLLGFSYSMIAPKVYESKMMVTSYILTDSYNDKLGENLNDIIDDGSMELLAKKLNLSNDEVGNVVSVKIVTAQKERSQKEDEKRWFLITARVFDLGILSKLEHGIVSYLENNDFVKVRVEQRKNFYKKLIMQIDEEILSLENFKAKIYNGDFFERSNGNIMFDPTEVNSKIVELSENKFRYQNELEVVNSVQIVEGFTRFEKPIRPNKAISLAAGATLGLFFVGLLLAFKSVRKVVRLAEENQQK